MVKTNTGYQPIANIKIGDQVLAKNELNGEISYKTVTAQYSNPYAQTVHIRISDANGKTQILMTNTIHPFYANGKWIPSGSLKTGDVLLDENGAAQTVQSVETKAEELTAYNLTVADFHTYFVKGVGSGTDAVWVHNECAVPLQTGNNKITKATANRLNEEWGTNYAAREIGRALEKLKKDNNVPNGHHGKIMSNGDYVDEFGNVIDNIAGYIP